MPSNEQVAFRLFETTMMPAYPPPSFASMAIGIIGGSVNTTYRHFRF